MWSQRRLTDSQAGGLAEISRWRKPPHHIPSENPPRQGRRSGVTTKRLGSALEYRSSLHAKTESGSEGKSRSRAPGFRQRCTLFFFRDDGDGAWQERREQSEQPGHERQRGVQLRASGGEDDDGDAERGEVLLELQVAVTGDENLEALRFHEREEASVFDAAPLHSRSGRAIVTRDRPAEPPVQTFVEKEAHGSDGFQHPQFPSLDDGEHLPALHRGKAFEEVFDGFPAFEGINEVLQRHPRARKDGRAPHDFRVAVNDAFEVFSVHGGRIAALAISRPLLFCERIGWMTGAADDPGAIFLRT